MPHRTYHLLLGIAGLVAVGALLLIGANLLRHSHSGSRLKQRLVSAGLLLLGSLGLTLGGACDAGGLAGCSGASAKQRRDGPRQRIASATRDALEVVRGKRGSYPFDEAGQKRLLARLGQAIKDVDALAQQGKISAGEAGLWKKDLEQLVTGVSKYRPVEMKNATCYEPMPVQIPARASIARLKARLPFLQQMAAARKLDPEVTRKVLRQIEADLSLLQREPDLARLPDAKQRRRARKLAREVNRQLQRIRAKLGHKAGGGRTMLKQTPEWQALKSALQAMSKLAGRSSKSTGAERKSVDSKLTAALGGIAALKQRGLLTDAEVGLLEAEGKRLRRDVYRYPPSDFRGRCYRRAAYVPARESLERINRRLPLLRKLAAQGKLSSAVVERILPVLEQDIRMLGGPDRLQPDERARAKKAAAQARALLSQIKRQIGD